MLNVGDAIPAGARLFTLEAKATTTGEHLARERQVLVCFYPFDWSSG